MEKEKINIDGYISNKYEPKGGLSKREKMKNNENIKECVFNNTSYFPDFQYDAMEFGVQLMEMLGIANEISKKEEKLIQEWGEVSKNLNKKTMKNLKTVFINMDKPIHKKMLNTMLEN